jgi:hypothetical protein
VRRFVIVALFALAGTVGFAAKRALLIGIGDYPDLKTISRLDGTGTDLDKMRFLLRACGFVGSGVQELRGPAATRDAINASLDDLVKASVPKDEVVFYFSGRGSVAAPLSGEEMIPTIVPVDGKAADASMDISITRLEEWATALSAKKVIVTIILDASYRRPFRGRGEDRTYKHYPKVMPRDGEPRRQLYSGPGVFIAATGSSGNAYEAKLDTNEDVWASAFTQDFVGATLMKLETGGATYAEIIGELQMYFAGQTEQGYMPGFDPYPEVADMGPEYFKRAFAAGKAPEPSAAELAKIKELNRQRRDQGRRLRVAVDTESSVTGEDRKKLLAAATPELEAALKGLDRVRLLPKFVGGADRVVFLSGAPGSYQARVTGDEVDASQQGSRKYSGATIQEVMKDGLSDYLQRQAYQLRLFRLADSDKPTLKTAFSVKVKDDLPKLHVGETIAYEVKSGVEGLIYLLDRDDSDGRIHLILPVKEESNNLIGKGQTTLPRDVEYEILPGTQPGRTRVLALLVQSAKPLPPLKAGEDQYEAAELAHLAALIKALESGTAKWISSSVEYQVAKSP